MAASSTVTSVRSRLRRERSLYLEDCATTGGTAGGFRKWIEDQCAADPRLFPYEGLRDEAATKIWQEQPRKTGPDLFSINGLTIGEFLTRPTKGYVEGDDLDNPDQFEKIAARFATVADLIDDSNIKLRNAARASASAERDAQAADEARRRARGDIARFLRDLTD